MSQLATLNGITMTSLELAEMVGVRHADFLEKVPKVLGEGQRKFSSSYRSVQNKTLPMYVFPKREACLMAMSYSYEMQAAVYDRMTALEQHLDSLTNALKHRYAINIVNVPAWAFSALQMAETRFHWKLAMAGFQLPSGCCPDISIGQSFCRHMRELGHDTDSLATYNHVYPDGRFPVSAKLYPNEWLTEFQTWFDEKWIPKYIKSASLRKHLPAPQMQKCVLALGVST